jgi:tRNA (guanine26-N2/guanine27-N2)-dimethyltransferase
LGYLIHCESTGYSFTSSEREFCCTPGDEGKVIVPLWIGKLFNEEFINEIERLLKKRFSYLATMERIERLLKTIKDEILVQDKVYQHIPSIASKVSGRLPPFQKLIECLQEEGFVAVRTHFDPLGIRTNSAYQHIYSCLKS